MNEDYEIPEGGAYLWEWFEEFSSGLNRIDDGTVLKGTWSELLAWANVTGRIVSPEEYAILRAMDDAWRSAMQIEVTEARTRQQAENEAKQAAKSGKGTKRRR